MADKKIDPFDVEALERSVNDSATRVSAIWVSFLIFGLYLVIAAGTVTHRQLLLEDPIKLPVLNIELPLVGFFFLAPILFVIFHAYVLLQVLLLGRTAAAYNEAVERAAFPAEKNDLIRQRLANTLFAQIFAGSPRERDDLLGILLKAMAWITLVIAPVLILLVFQFQFLPYHSYLITWTHRLLIAIELILVATLWPLALDQTLEMTWRRFFKLWRMPAALAALALYVFFSLSLFTFPGELHVNRFAGQPFEMVECKRWFHVKGDPTAPLYQRLWAQWQLFDRLNLARVDVVDDDKLEKIKEHTKAAREADYRGERTQLLRERDFNCGNLSNFADLRRVDFTGASLRGASFDGSKLQGASFDNAQLQGASLDSAQLQGASLDSAQLQGASLDSAQLQGASLNWAQLQGASLQGADLQGASLYSAQLQGASLQHTELRGGLLLSAHLQGASLDSAQLQGASLQHAELQGASLDSAQLQGADLYDAELLETALSRAAVWRARDANCSNARVQGSKYDPIIQFQYVREQRFWGPSPQSRGTDYSFVPSSDDPTPEATAKFIEDAVIGISDPMKQQVIYRLRAGLVDPTKDDPAKIENDWRACEDSSGKVPQAEFDKKHAAFLRKLVCDAIESRAAIAKGIIRNWISDDESRSDFSAQLARGLLGEDGKPCAATKDLDEGNKKRLRAAAPPDPTTTPAPAPASSP